MSIFEKIQLTERLYFEAERCYFQNDENTCISKMVLLSSIQKEIIDYYENIGDMDNNVKHSLRLASVLIQLRMLLPGIDSTSQISNILFYVQAMGYDNLKPTINKLKSYLPK